jgi:Cu(I)/Ag(I) efflux system membrane protein CusA/SilA
MLLYLNQAYEDLLETTPQPNHEQVAEAVVRGAGLRVRPVMMTAASIILGLLPILYGSGTGSEVMSRIAAPMVGGMVSAVLVTLLVLPAVFYLWRRSPGL